MGVRLTVLAAAVATVVLLPPVPGRAEPLVFLTAVEDLPLAPGLIEQPASGLVFDTAEGRIVEAYAEGAVSAEAIITFYAEALPELGWVRRGAFEYGREDEVLRLEILPRGSSLAVRFALHPGR